MTSFTSFSCVPLSFACSPCPNDTCIFDALIHGKIPFSRKLQPHFYDIEQLNEFALQGRFDVMKVSTFTLGKITKEYQLLHSGAAVGKGVGPQIVSKDKIKIKECLTIAIPGLQTTARLLLELVFPGTKNLVVMPYHMILNAITSGQVDAGVIIHESRFMTKEMGLHVIDLGKLYEERFQCPIPLGVIVGKRSLGKELLQQVEKAIFDSIHFAKKNPESSRTFVAHHAQ